MRICVLYVRVRAYIIVYRCRAYQSDDRRRKCTYENEKKSAHREGETLWVLKSLKRV